jgi:hypothetical protein
MLIWFESRSGPMYSVQSSYRRCRNGRVDGEKRECLTPSRLKPDPTSIGQTLGSAVRVGRALHNSKALPKHGRDLEYGSLGIARRSASADRRTVEVAVSAFDHSLGHATRAGAVERPAEDRSAVSRNGKE